MSTHYVDNKKLYSVILEYKEKVKQAESNNEPKPDIPNYVGQCVLLIAQRLSSKPNFVNYSYKEEMISDGIENCISYFDNFDPSKSDNPFAYFTQIIYYAFLRRIQKEKKQIYIRHKSMEHDMLYNLHVEFQNSEDGENYMTHELNADNVIEFIRSFEENMNKKKTKTAKGIEKFFDEGTEEQ